MNGLCVQSFTFVFMNKSCQMTSLPRREAFSKDQWADQLPLEHVSFLNLFN